MAENDAKAEARTALYEEITAQVQHVKKYREGGSPTDPTTLLKLAEAFAWVTDVGQPH